MEDGQMKFTIRAGLIGASALALVACGDSDDASDEVIADNVEIPADDAMSDVTDEPMMDDEVAAPEPAPAPEPVETQTDEERQEAVRRSVEDEAAAAEATAAEIQAELDKMSAEN
ncbi:MAG: hypothetical protein CL801_06645 [Citromicrobium sp.]|nr:hypothetical protein [Citromicrobium sp.]|tara:strand:+ start:668 stop:1012 length:345 start_codon:yes stop_codon:yes gene_type:complete